jgi:methyl-accepting chemotaxis protein
MLKNLKIVTGINAVVFFFIFLLLSIISYGYYSTSQSSRHSAEFVEITENVRLLNDALYDVNASLEKVYRLTLMVSEGKIPEESQVKAVQQVIATAEGDLNRFYSKTHAGIESKNIDNLKLRADKLIMLIKLRLNHIYSADSIVAEINEITTARDGFKSELEQYNAQTAKLVAQIEEKASTNRYHFNILVIAIGCLTVVMAILTHRWLRRDLSQRLDATVKTFQVMSTGKLDEEITAGRPNEIGKMFIELEKLRQWITQTVSGIRNGVSHINLSAQEIIRGNNDLSSRTEQQASALQQTAASMEELKITVRQNADNAHAARQLAETASVSARNGGEVMSGLNEIMRRITESSRQIGDINSVIDSIANQTNILALNAAVEAARAGEQGRGFAVVAGEVRNLAKRSADAAKEIRSLINICVADMNMGSQEVEQAGTAMQQIIQSVTQVTDIMSEIASASDEQSTGINQIAQAVNELDLVTQQNATMVQQAATAAASMEEHAQQLNNMVAHIRLKQEAGVYDTAKTQLLNRPLSITEKNRSDTALDHMHSEGDWESF